MSKSILVCNAGSTSLKLKLFKMPSETVLAYAKVDRIGSDKGSQLIYRNASHNRDEELNIGEVPDHLTAIKIMLPYIIGKDLPVTRLEALDAVGFKTVLALGHTGVCKLTDDVLSDLKDAETAAPLHNKVYLEAITAFKKLCPEVLLMGAFETYFHSQRPLYSRIYGIPYSWFSRGIQKYGFHGASHEYVSGRMKELNTNNLRIISCHLGGSSSICAIFNGKCIDISSGFSPQTGLPHANRTGDLDAYAIIYLLDSGFNLNDIKSGLNGGGGLLGISGISGDMRDLEFAAANGSERACLAIDTLTYDVVKHIGAYTVLLGGLDALIFTGGIGENSAFIRNKVCSKLSYLGIHLNCAANSNTGIDSLISDRHSRSEVWVIHTNEELNVARRVYKAMT